MSLPVNGDFNPQRDGATWSNFFMSLVERAAAMPNVVAVGAVSVLPLTAGPESSNFGIDNQPRPSNGQSAQATA